ncbi:MAG: IS110 family transposase [Planctomycetota bacterium]|nr:IS110 family transposase [Planctomycetota bacterium]
MYNQTKNKRSVKINEGVIGVDIGKYHHVAVGQSWDGQRMKPLVFSNTLSGFNRLKNYQESAKRYLGVSRIQMAFEPTGHYWEPLAQWLEQAGIDLEMVQPSHTHKAKELEDNSPGKTDGKDAGVIADLSLQGKSQRLLAHKAEFAELRYLTHFRHKLVVDKNREVNRFHRLMDLIFPELLGIFKKNLGKGLMALLNTAVLPEKILALGVERVEKILSQHSQGKLGIKRAELVTEAAKNSVGIKSGLVSLEMELRQILERIAFVKKQCQEIEEAMKKVLAEVPYSKILLSIPGIGEITIAMILGEVGDLRGYHSASEVIKLAGLNLYEISSGEYHGQRRITKRGKPLLRLILYMASLRMIRAKGKFNIFYQRLTEKGKAKTKGIVAVMCKLIRVIFAMVRDEQMFKERQYIKAVQKEGVLIDVK